MTEIHLSPEALECLRLACVLNNDHKLGIRYQASPTYHFSVWEGRWHLWEELVGEGLAVFIKETNVFGQVKQYNVTQAGCDLILRNYNKR